MSASFGSFEAAAASTSAAPIDHNHQRQGGYGRQAKGFGQQHGMPMTNMPANCPESSNVSMLEQQQVGHSTVAGPSSAPLLQMPIDFTNIMMLDSSTNLLDSSSVFSFFA